MKPTDKFMQKAPPYMARLMKRFDLSVDDAAAVFGNLGHESIGFTALQEIKPTVPGSAGGYGWAQWTGPRRRQFEAFCKAEGLAPATDEANYRFLEFELAGPERKAIPKLKAAVGLENKTIAFEAAYERAGVKHYASRQQWANLAKASYLKSQAAPELARPPAPVEPAKPVVVPAADETPKNKITLQSTMAAIAALIVAAAAAIFTFHR